MGSAKILAAFVIALATSSTATAQMAGLKNQAIPRVPPVGVMADTAPKPPSAALEKGALVGREVFSKDQLRVGQVELVIASSDGAVQAIHIKAGGFLGFGGKLVEIPHEKFWMRGTNVQLDLTSDEINHLPQVKDRM